MIVCALPHATETTGRRISSAAKAFCVVPSNPIPSWPKLLLPVEKRVWSARQTTAWSVPAAIAAILLTDGNPSRWTLLSLFGFVFSLSLTSFTLCVAILLSILLGVRGGLNRGADSRPNAKQLPATRIQHPSTSDTSLVDECPSESPKCAIPGGV